MTVKQGLENEPFKLMVQNILVGEVIYKVSEIFERWHISLYNYMAFGHNDHKRLRTTNVLERLNLELKSRIRKIGAFSSDQSLLRLVVSKNAGKCGKIMSSWNSIF